MRDLVKLEKNGKMELWILESYLRRKWMMQDKIELDGAVNLHAIDVAVAAKQSHMQENLFLSNMMHPFEVDFERVDLDSFELTRL